MKLVETPLHLALDLDVAPSLPHGAEKGPFALGMRPLISPNPFLLPVLRWGRGSRVLVGGGTRSCHLLVNPALGQGSQPQPAISNHLRNFCKTPMWYNLLKNCCHYPWKLNICIYLNNSTPRYRLSYRHLCRETRTGMPIAGLLVRANTVHVC